MKGKIYGIGGGAEKITITFNTTPSEAIVTLRDRDGKEVHSSNNKVYRIPMGLYYYDVTASGYVGRKNIEVKLLEDETIDITLQKEVYGVRRNIANSETTWERLEGGIDKTANAVNGIDNIDSTLNDFDNIYPWSNIRTCALNKSGNVLKYADEPDWNWTDYDYVMTEVPEFYWNREQKVEDGATWEYIYISQSQTDLTPNKSEKFYIGRYTATGSSSDVTTKRGVANLVDISITDLRNATKKIGTNWGLMDILRWSLIQMLYLVEYADYDCQKTIGYGVCNGSIINTGALDSLQMKSGCLANDKKSAVIYRGIENIFGNIYQWCDGINFTDSQACVCTDPTKYESDKFASPYTKLGWKCPSTNGYIKDVGYDASFPALQLTKTTSGSDSTYIPDYSFYGLGSRVLRVGGYCNDGLYCGLWFFYWYYYSSYSASYVGGRLLYIPSEI